MLAVTMFCKGNYSSFPTLVLFWLPKNAAASFCNSWRGCVGDLQLGFDCFNLDCEVSKCSSPASCRVTPTHRKQLLLRWERWSKLLLPVIHLTGVRAWSVGFKLSWDSPERQPDMVGVFNLASCLPLCPSAPLDSQRWTLDGLVTPVMTLGASQQGFIWASPFHCLCSFVGVQRSFSH